MTNLTIAAKSQALELAQAIIDRLNKGENIFSIKGVSGFASALKKTMQTGQLFDVERGGFSTSIYLETPE